MNANITRFVVSYPQTNWDYAKFRLNRIIRGKDKSNDVFQGFPGGKIELFEHTGELGGIKSLGEICPIKPFGMHYVAGEGLYFITGLPCSKDSVAFFALNASVSRSAHRKLRFPV
ncbi:MAG: hypothetical protein M0Q44_04600 [Methylobacter sp.]|jgi:hypothetical protein|nr:hypothetical protein [Methylobacter sp.]